jgi:aryl-alcohol dehydrogenase-like predicted oxidoreductase
MIHWPDSKVDIRKTMEVLAKARLEGKIHHIGLCNTHAQDFQKAFEVDEIAAVQSQFNLFEKGSDEELDALMKKNMTALMSWGTLDKGIITGRVELNRKFDKSDCRSWAPWWKAMDKESRYKMMDKIWPLLKSYDIRAVDMAVQYNLHVHQVDLVLCGAKNVEQLEGVLKATKASLPESFFKELGVLLQGFSDHEK